MFLALSPRVEPPLTEGQRSTVMFALGCMTITFMCGICGWISDGLFYESWTRYVSGKNPEASWRTRKRANLFRKAFG